MIIGQLHQGNLFQDRWRSWCRNCRFQARPAAGISGGTECRVGSVPQSGSRIIMSWLSSWCRSRLNGILHRRCSLGMPIKIRSVLGSPASEQLGSVLGHRRAVSVQPRIQGQACARTWLPWQARLCGQLPTVAPSALANHDNGECCRGSAYAGNCQASSCRVCFRPRMAGLANALGAVTIASAGVTALCSDPQPLVRRFFAVSTCSVRSAMRRTFFISRASDWPAAKAC